jgi:signal transduction histidine kinase
VLYSMIFNLCDNAIKYNHPGGSVKVQVMSYPDDDRVIVADTGIGIPEESRDRIFERFYRALGTKVSGTGLGLAIVRRIVAMHDASIQIEDGFPRADGSGCGARFVVRIPFDRTKLN